MFDINAVGVRAAAESDVVGGAARAARRRLCRAIGALLESGDRRQPSGSGAKCCARACARSASMRPALLSAAGSSRRTRAEEIACRWLRGARAGSRRAAQSTGMMPALTLPRSRKPHDHACTASRSSPTATALRDRRRCSVPRGSEVLVRVERCGVCHSDLHHAGRLFLARRRQAARRQRRAHAAVHARPRDRRHRRSAGADAADAGIGQPRRGLSLDRLRPMRGVPGGRRKSLLRAPPSRHHCRRRLCHACSGSASALSARLRAAVGRLRRPADVLGAHRVRGAQAARRARRARRRYCWSAWAASA